MNVAMFVFSYVQLVCLSVYGCAGMHVYICICWYVRMYICVYECICAYVIMCVIVVQSESCLGKNRVVFVVDPIHLRFKDRHTRRFGDPDQFMQ